MSSPPTRVVSLVPSDTESVALLCGLDVLVGRTSFCEEPRGEIERVPVVGGTKNIDVKKVIALRPDLVLANKEENSRRDVEALLAAGIPLYLSFPQSVAEALAHVATLRQMLGLPSIDGPTPASSEPSVRVFVPIWRDPWMTFDRRTYASDLLAFAGAVNVFADRARRYPLAADLGTADALDAGDRDTRYPRVTLEEVRQRAPELILLPDEPYAFGEPEARELEGEIPGARALPISGKDLFWYGVRTHAAIDRVRARLRAS